MNSCSFYLLSIRRPTLQAVQVAGSTQNCRSVAVLGPLSLQLRDHDAKADFLQLSFASYRASASEAAGKPFFRQASTLRYLHVATQPSQLGRLSSGLGDILTLSCGPLAESTGPKALAGARGRRPRSPRTRADGSPSACIESNGALKQKTKIWLIHFDAFIQSSCQSLADRARCCPHTTGDSLWT